MCFWEQNPQHAWGLAMQARNDPRITRGEFKTPFVLGAIIDLGLCCDLLESSALKELQETHPSVASVNTLIDRPMPVNRVPGSSTRL